MVVVKILKRKDASSLVVGVVVAMLVLQFVAQVTQELAGRIALWQWGSLAPAYGSPSGGYKVTYVQPLVGLILGLLVVEVLCWLYLGLHSLLMGGKKR